MSQPGDELDATVPATAPNTAPAPKVELGGELKPNMTIGRYRLDARLGAGSMGEVWAATDPQLERSIAIKLVHPQLARDPEAAARMVREARAMAKLSHRAVITIHDAGEVDGRLYLAMALVRGRTLGAVMRDRTAVELRDWRRWLRMLRVAGEGLAAAHAANVLHRDFKPDNVLVDERGRIFVGDFGLATLGTMTMRVSRPTLTASSEPDLTTTGALLGTPAYMSLEQMRGDVIDARSDQFSYCVTLYEALYGVRPFTNAEDRTNLVALAEAIAAGAIQPAPEHSHVPAAVRAAVVRGLAASPDARWPDLRALLDALDRGAFEGAKRTNTRRVAVTAAIGAAAIAAGTIALVGHRAPDRRAPTLIGPMPMRAIFALSTGGRLAIGTDRVEVRELDTGKVWAAQVSNGAFWIDALEFEDESVVRWFDRSNLDAKRWPFIAGQAIAALPVPDGTFLGWLGGGVLVERPEGVGTAELVLVRDEHVVRTWHRDAALRIDVSAPSPSHDRFAYLEQDRFTGNVVVLDAVTGQSWRSNTIVDPTGIGWRDDNTVLVAAADPTPGIYELPIAATGFQPRRKIHDFDPGTWAGKLLIAGGRVLCVLVTPSTRVRVIGRDPPSIRDLESSLASSELGWSSDDTFVAWSRSTKYLEPRTLTATAPRFAAKLDAEPVNATFAGTTLIATLRDQGGRKVVAISLATGEIAWQLPVGDAFAARCAADRVPPCFVAKRMAEPGERYAIMELDVTTGRPAGATFYTGKLEDFAVSDDGRHLLVADTTNDVRELDRTGAVIAIHHTTFALVRSVAYDPRGGFLASGTITGNSYALGRHDGTTFDVLTTADGELLLMVRPARTGAQILVVGRTLASQLWQLE